MAGGRRKSQRDWKLRGFADQKAHDMVGAESSSGPKATKEMGLQSCNHEERNSANYSNELGR